MEATTSTTTHVPSRRRRLTMLGLAMLAALPVAKAIAVALHLDVPFPVVAGFVGGLWGATANPPRRRRTRGGEGG